MLRKLELASVDRLKAVGKFRRGFFTREQCHLFFPQSNSTQLVTSTGAVEFSKMPLLAGVRLNYLNFAMRVRIGL